MATPPQGLVQFGPLTDFVSASFTLTQGTTPSTCVIDVAPFDFLLPPIAELRFSFGSVLLRFPGAAVDKIEPVGDASGLIMWRITILDRRWAWRDFGTISGRYNADPDQQDQGAKYVEKTLRELLRLCLDALGETDAIIAGSLANQEILPSVDWDYELPAKALADLCERSGNIVTIGLDNIVRVFPRGAGASLPTADLIESQLTVDAPEAPSRIIIVGLPDRYQFDFILDPVGRELDGTIKPINELSYAPRVNNVVDWSENDPFLHSRVPVGSRKLAQETVWKWYRIRPGFTLPGPDAITVNERSEIALLNEQVEKQIDSEGREIRRPAWVFGRWSPIDDNLDPAAQVVQRLSNQPGSVYDGSFSIDAANYLVKFSDPIFRWSKTKEVGGASPATGFYVYAPDIRLRTSMHYNKGGFEGVKRTEFCEDKIIGGTTNRLAFRPWTRFVISEDIGREIYFDYEANRLEDNEAEQLELAEDEWQVVVDEYATLTNAQSASYAGLVPIACDGAIAQVTFDIDAQGFTRTRISRNREELFTAPSYAERRTFEKIDQVLRRRK